MALSLPDPDTSQLPKSPLELVVCQIRFEAHPNVSDGSFALAFHEALGGSEGDYSTVEQTMTASGNLIVGPGGPSMSSGGQVAGWRYRSSDGGWVISLQQDHVALETTDYGTWENDFAPRLDQVLNAVAEHIAPSFEQRLGLRYIDRITELKLGALADWKPYIRKELLGPICHEEIGDSIRATHQQLLLEVSESASCNLRHGGVDDPEAGTVDYLLDYDLYRDGGRRFEVDDINAAASEFNKYALQLFHASITDELLKFLRG